MGQVHMVVKLSLDGSLVNSERIYCIMRIIKILRSKIFLNLLGFFNICTARPCIKVLFPGSGSILPKVLELINGEKSQIDFAQYSLLHPEIVSALSSAASRGVKVLGVVDQNSIELIGKHILLKDKHAQSSASLLAFLSKKNIDVYASHGRIMHNKIMCFACNSQTNEPVVVTGSANCTVSGLKGVFKVELKKDCSHNFENLLILQGYKKIYDKYVQEINKIREEVVRQQDKRCDKK